MVVFELRPLANQILPAHAMSDCHPSVFRRRLQVGVNSRFRFRPNRFRGLGRRSLRYNHVSGCLFLLCLCICLYWGVTFVTPTRYRGVTTVTVRLSFGFVTGLTLGIRRVFVAFVLARRPLGHALTFNHARRDQLAVNTLDLIRLAVEKIGYRVRIPIVSARSVSLGCRL